MPRGRSYPSDSDQSDGPVIIEREPDFVNLFRARKPSIQVIYKESHRPRPRAGGLGIAETRERNRERRRSDESAPMSGGRRQAEFVPLPPRIPIPHPDPDPDPIIEIISPHRRGTPEVHQPRRNSFNRPMDRSPVRVPGPERMIERERDRRRQAEDAAERIRRAATRDRERRRRQADELAQRFSRVVINERETRREAEEGARRLAAEAQEAQDRARQAEYALARERHLAERERLVQERRRQAEREEREEAEARLERHRSVQIVQRDPPLIVDRGAEVLRLAQEVERRRRELDLLYQMERDRYDPPRRRRSITVFEDDKYRHRRQLL